MKDQESHPRPHTPRPAALPIKVEQWVSEIVKRNKASLLKLKHVHHMHMYTPYLEHVQLLLQEILLI